MAFDIDLSKYRIVDLALEVRPGQTAPDRPYEVREGRLGDGTWKFDIVNTHTHVGTHVESPWHFYGTGKTCTDYPIEKFMGAARLCGLAPESPEAWISCDMLRAKLDPYQGAFSILFLRNDSATQPLHVHMDGVSYLAELGLDLLVFESTIEFGQGIEDGRAFHDILMSRDTLFVEFPANGAALDRDAFFVFAVPLRITGLDSSPCRLFAILDR
ncbi:MAG TPA: cyclase family protein [Candidatus Hydrogenedentes bacterium]|nr:cyclase family protein [Candidatus Hydrogenedentota bacterium]HPG67511.1 cyclase family protein [Candidatus Hydrogenedentota bacterium]